MLMGAWCWVLGAGWVLGGCWVANEDMLVGFNSRVELMDSLWLDNKFLRREAAMRRRKKTAISFADSQDSRDQLKISNTLLIVAPSFVIT